MTSQLACEGRLLVLLPEQRDVERIVRMLSEEKMEAVACANMRELCDKITEGAGAALLTGEAILSDSERCLENALRREPPWSSFPLIVLTQPGLNIQHLPSPALLNLTLVERPVGFVTLRSVIESALRHRRHQYEIRDTLLDLERAEQDLRNANRELENRVRERTHKLQETINELEAFSYSISHDLRAPLRSMQGYAQALLEDHGAMLNEEGQRFLSKISASAARLDLLVQDVLAYSRVAKGDVELRNVSVAEVVREVLESYPHLRDKAAIDIPGPLPVVRAHPGYLTQCVSNLLGNAVKFVRPGTQPKVRIRAEPEPEPGMDRIRVCFEDNGIGIARQHFDDIFRIFGRVHPGSAYEGTGIGLAIVRKAAERMGGAVGVTSEPGKGSCFWLSLRKGT